MAVEPREPEQPGSNPPRSRLLNQEMDFMKQLCLEETKALIKRYSRFTDVNALTNMMVELSFGKIVSLIKDMSEVEDLWGVIDNTIEGVNFITELTQRFFMYYPTDFNRGRELLELFSNGVEIMHPQGSASSAGKVGVSGIPEEQLSDMPATGKFYQILAANRWMVPILLWQISDPEDVLDINPMVEAWLAEHASRAQGGIT